MNINEKLELGYCSHWRGQNGLVPGKFERPGSKPSYAPDRNVDTQHIRLEIRFDIARKIVYGKCTLSLKSLVPDVKEIIFDAVKMKINSVILHDGEKLKYTYDGKQIKIKLPQSVPEEEALSITIQYQITRPFAGVYFIGPDKYYPKKPVQIWTHGEAEESRCWFPCFDAPHDKATTEMMATVPRDFFALSNGELIGVQENKTQKTKTYHWKQSIPHSPYLVTLAAGKFSEIKDEWNDIPILYYCEPGREKDTQRAFGKTPKMVKFFSEVIGVPYPYEKYAQIAVADFVMGGMEHTTATTQTDRVLMDAKAYPEFNADWLVSHELAHQWFGDLLTCKEWSHAWLNESFATYFEALFTEHDLGKDEFEYEMLDKLTLYLEEDRETYRRAIVTNVYQKPDDLFDRHLYEKGSLVLHTLRFLLGDRLFWKSIKHYVETFQGMAVETHDFINAIGSATGKNLRKFFDQWVYGPGHPDYTVRYWWDEKKKTARIYVEQKPVGNHAIFSMPVELEFSVSSGKKLFVETLDQKKHEFQYKFSDEPLDFRFDPGVKILKVASLTKPYKMWVKQLQSDPHVFGRIQAAKEIAKVKTEQSVKILCQAFRKEKFWGVSREIAQALGSTGLPEAKNFLLESLEVKNPKTRRGVVEALGNFADPLVIAGLKKVFKKDPSYFVAAESLQSILNSRLPGTEAFVCKALDRASWNDTIRARAIASLARVPNALTTRLFRKWAQYGNSPSVRAAALQSMAKNAKHFPQFFEDLIFFTQDAFPRIQSAAIKILGNLKDPRAIPALEKIARNKDLPYRTVSAAEDAVRKIRPEFSKPGK